MLMISEELKEARRAYYREYRKKNKDKINRSYIKFWTKQAEQQQQQQEQQ